MQCAVSAGYTHHWDCCFGWFTQSELTILDLLSILFSLALCLVFYTTSILRFCKWILNCQHLKPGAKWCLKMENDYPTCFNAMKILSPFKRFKVITKKLTKTNGFVQTFQRCKHKVDLEWLVRSARHPLTRSQRFLHRGIQAPPASRYQQESNIPIRPL